MWLQGATPTHLKTLPTVLGRIEKVREFRLASRAETTRAFAAYPTQFRQVSQPDIDYLAIPEVSSERRDYIPIAMLPKEVICSNTVQYIPTDSLYIFGMITSEMHMAWMRSIAGRLESRYRYSNTIVYNNFPFPISPSDNSRKRVETVALQVLDARNLYSNSTLADLYDPNTMPIELVKAHKALDKAVDSAYGRRSFKTESERVNYLMKLHDEYTGQDSVNDF